MKPIQSFDIFDTLIARRCVGAEAVHAEVESRAAIPGLAAARRQADQILHGMGPDYDLPCIYVMACRLLGLPLDRAAALAQLEFELECENVRPIAENLQRVRGDDLLISDMYLSEAQIRQLLARAGAPLRNALLVSSHGKSSGQVWDALKGLVAIGLHRGDNAHSDVAMPQRRGVPCELVTQHRPSNVEARLLAAGQSELAQTLRTVRLGAALSDTSAVLWNVACQLNFPLLVFSSIAVAAAAARLGSARAVFFGRDGNMWTEVFRALYPELDSRYMYCSRETFYAPSASFNDYFDECSGTKPLYVDLYSTGGSFGRYMAQRGMTADFFVMCYADDTKYRTSTAAEMDSLRIHAAFNSSSLSLYGKLGLGVEMANFARHRRVRDVRRLPQGPVPVLADETEFDEAHVATQQQSLHACLKELRAPRLLHEAHGADVVEWMKAFYTAVNGHQALMACFPEHAGADQAYRSALREKALGA